MNMFSLQYRSTVNQLAVWLRWHGICFWTHLSLLLLFKMLGWRQPCDSWKLCVLCFGGLPWALRGLCLNCIAQCQRQRTTQQRLERRTHFPPSAVNFNNILRAESSIFIFHPIIPFSNEPKTAILAWLSGAFTTHMPSRHSHPFHSDQRHVWNTSRVMKHPREPSSGVWTTSTASSRCKGDTHTHSLINSPYRLPHMESQSVRS